MAEPDNAKAAYNRSVLWMHRDGPEGMQRARLEIERLHRDHPDYAFATIALSLFVARDGDHEKAHKLLSPIFQQKRLHLSEACALFTAQAQIYLGARDTDGAQRAIAMLSKLAGEYHPNVVALRERIERASARRGLLKSLFQ